MDTTRTSPWKIGFLILAIAVLLWIGYAVTVPRLAMDWEKANRFGGMFGGIGALFSGLALAGVVVAVLMQREELELQREELTATRAELKRSAEAQEEQVQLSFITAQLQALNTLVTSEGDTIKRVPIGSDPFYEAKAKQDKYLARIADLMDRVMTGDATRFVRAYVERAAKRRPKPQSF